MADFVELKTPRSYQDQLAKLKEHGLTIVDDSVALDVISTVNYYRLSAYGIGLMENGQYFPSVTFDHIYGLYCFDMQLRSLLIPVIERLEIELRTKIAYYIAMHYGAEGYLDPANFQHVVNKHGKVQHDNMIQCFRSAVYNQADMPFVKHHMEKYGGHFPSWVAVELFTFGMLSTLYTIMFPDARKSIAKEYRTESVYLESWIISLVEIRNICAHYGRLYNRPLTKSPRLYSEYSRYVGDRIFPIILTMRRMLRGCSVWNTFYQSLIGLFEEHPEVNLHFIGFPPDWQEVLAP